ncbi:hypothetical protein [Synechococcus sp. UW105]|uniref:hypothetical protein n=1 Tax=Synechococcus sp. UW105 TaxID=337067 RepID=UPI001FCAE337|nr:hypothetical protein [Synechococcus sp. UW105]
MPTLKWLHAALIGLFACALIGWPAQRVEACVEGLSWGMPLEQVRDHLGQSQPVDDEQPHRFVASHVLLDRLPVSSVTFDLDETNGLQSLAYEFAIDDMSEVLAGLRSRHGQPLSTSSEDQDQSEQVWVWNTGEDLITAVKHQSAEQAKFLISYRQSRLRPETL